MNTKQMQEMVFSLKLQSKQIERMQKKCEKDAEKEKKKVAKAITQGNAEGARLYAEGAIRQRTQAMNYARLASRVDATAGKIEQAVAMNQVTGQITRITTKLAPTVNAMNSMEVAMGMEKFSQVFEDLEVSGDMQMAAMSGATTGMTPEDSVNALLQEVGDEHALDVGSMLTEAQPGTGVGTIVEPAAGDEIEKRFAALRAQAM